MGRQAIYDAAGSVVGFELLFRATGDADHADRSTAAATAEVIINIFGEFGTADVAGDRLCFINLTRDFLVGALPVPFGPQGIVLEVLETVQVDDAVVDGVAALVEAGYRIALDDFRRELAHERLLPFASVVKLDLLNTPEDELRGIVEECAGYPGITLLGEKLETAAHIAQARALGCQLFQGYDLGRPTTFSARTLSASRMGRLQLMAALGSANVDLPKIISMVSVDPALSVQVLRVTNSIGTGLRRRLSSVHEAVVLLGAQRIREWVTVLAASDIAGNTDDTEFVSAVTRGRMCQLVAPHLDVPGEVAFTAGLLLGIADMLHIPIDELIGGLNVSEELHDALVKGSGRLGALIRLVVAYERSDLLEIERSGLPSTDLIQAYLTAVAWTTQTIGTLRTDRSTAGR